MADDLHTRALAALAVAFDDEIKGRFVALNGWLTGGSAALARLDGAPAERFIRGLREVADAYAIARAGIEKVFPQ